MKRCIQWPPPGSTEAKAKGCTCPTKDNHFGKGQPSPGGDAAHYWVDKQCPVHAKLVNDD